MVGPDLETLRRLIRSSTRPPTVCDHCAEAVHRDSQGWWCGLDDTAGCRSNLRGHEVAGEPR